MSGRRKVFFMVNDELLEEFIYNSNFFNSEVGLAKALYL